MSQRSRKCNFYTTYTGRRFYFEKPSSEMICLPDIAHALAHQCRFGGHSSHFYSVAEHAVLVSYYVPMYCAAEALMHDAAEAYYGDVWAPMKRNLCFTPSCSMEDSTSYSALEYRLLKMIFQKYNLFWPVDPSIDRVDRELFIAEYQRLISTDLPEYLDGIPPLKLTGQTIVGQVPSVAKQKFLQRVEELGIRKNKCME